MPISGLSNQWKTREGLLEGFAEGDDQGRYGKIRQVLECLDARPGPTIYVGTSLSLMNFSNRDVVRDGDHTQPFAYLEVVQSRAGADKCLYRIKIRRIVGARPTTDWLLQECLDPNTVVDMLVEALAYADMPPRQR